MSESQQLSVQAARQFATKYAAASSEKSLGQSFWRDFLTDVVGISDLMVAGVEFEHPVRSSSGTIKFIDVLWSGVVLIEHKSQGKSLDDAEKQARDYLIALPPAKRPPTVIVSDFARIRIIEVLAGNSFELNLNDLPDHLDRIEMIIGRHAKAAAKPEVTADQKAVELMANLFVAFDKAGYGGHEVSVFLMRILFLNFGDDTGMWKRTPQGLFGNVIDSTEADSLGGRLQELFQILNTPVENRPRTLSTAFVDFPYVNGGIFKEVLPVFSFNAEMKDALFHATHYDWSKISPAIFGAMFQTVKSKEERRHLGEHYTSEENILKVIRPLFLDDLTDRLEKAWESISALKKLQSDLGKHQYLDPACGSGNFLVVSYKRLRDLEHKLIARLKDLEGTQDQHLLLGNLALSVHLGQFHGIEINEWSSQIAVVAMYLADHQSNIALSEITGETPARFPLTESAHIVHANALEIDWQQVCAVTDSTFVMGNPPFLGSRLMNAQQKDDQNRVWESLRGSGTSDFVTNWFILGSRYISKTGAKVGLVSTNSITQGDQPSVLWSLLRKSQVEIFFAHRTFSWQNEASGKAAVHCVIIGFSCKEIKNKFLWSYETPISTPSVAKVSQINAYLIDAPDIIVKAVKNPLATTMPKMFSGNKPRDGGYISNISPTEAEAIRNEDPIASKFLRPLIGADELLNNPNSRFCLWLVDATPNEIKESKILSTKVRQVYEERKDAPSSKGAAANRPALFEAITQPKGRYLAVPIVSSEKRAYIPCRFFDNDVIMNNKVFFIESEDLLIFGLLENRVFTAWVKVVSSRMKSDYQISASSVYNTFPFPTLTESQQVHIRSISEIVLQTRERFQDSSLGDLYDPVLMPKDLVTIHKELDNLILKIFGLKSSASDFDIQAKLFERYLELEEQHLIV